MENFLYDIGLIRIFYMGYLRIVRLFSRNVNLTSGGLLHEGINKRVLWLSRTYYSVYRAKTDFSVLHVSFGCVGFHVTFFSFG